VYAVSARNANLGSAITAPWGDILAYNDGDCDLIWADVDLDDRPSHHLGSTIRDVMRWMRRPAAYGALTAVLPPASAD
jgi:predicted amidohydrolase